MMFSTLPRYLSRLHLEWVAEREAVRQRPRAENERAVEYGFALRQLATHRPVKVLDVGTGTTAWPHLLHGCGYHVTAIDNVRDYWPGGMVNRHWPVLNVDVTDPRGFAGEFDAITCISVLEHIPAHQSSMKNMYAWLRPGGLLVLTCPFAGTYHPNVYVRPDASSPAQHAYICQSYAPAQLADWLSLGFTLTAAEHWRMFTGPVWRTGQPCTWERTDLASAQLGCFALCRTS